MSVLRSTFDRKRISKQKLTVLLHNREELDNDLGGRTDKNLTLATLFGVVDVVQSIVEDRDADHV
jgi:hypothetical protein